MTNVQCIRSPDAEGERLCVLSGCRRLTFAEVLAGWRDAPAVRETTLAALAASTHPAIFWEMPRLDARSLGDPYECMILPARGLESITPEPRAFADKLAARPDASILVFDNLGGDATLVAPSPDAPASAYGHLASFVRLAPSAQRHALLHTLAETALSLVAQRPLWISTSGLGVAWLHVRLDRRPKYYQCARYKARA